MPLSKYSIFVVVPAYKHFNTPPTCAAFIRENAIPTEVFKFDAVRKTIDILKELHIQKHLIKSLGFDPQFESIIQDEHNQNDFTAVWYMFKVIITGDILIIRKICERYNKYVNSIVK